MSDAVVYALFFGPLLLVVIAWAVVFKMARSRWPAAMTIAALSITSANALATAALFLHSRVWPSTLPPWKDPVNLGAGLLMLSVPFGMVVGLCAVRRGPAWLIWIVEIASIPLLLIGIGAGMSV